MSSRIAGLGRAAFLRSEYADLLEELRDKARSGIGWADRLWSGWRIADPNGLFANAEGLVTLGDDFYDTFRSLSVPKTFIYGERNFGAGASDTPDPERLKADGIAVAVIPGAGHAMMLDNHAAFVQALSSALGEGS
jgi:pimeloyl-ACP methyl ester carboxylesterase